MFSRRQLLALAAGATIGPARACAAAREPSGLGDLAARSGLLFGASISQEMETDPAYADLYVREAKILTTDTALVFDYLRPGPDRFSFGAADRMMAFARRHALPLRGHTLVWNEVAQPWLKRLSLRALTRVFDQHIETVAGRYAGRLHSWDVVNEPFWPGHGEPGGWRRGPWYAAMGRDYVKRAFARVATVDRTARLCLNEAQCENERFGREIRPALLRLVDDLRDAGVPLHAVGLQGHLKPQWEADPDAFPAFLQQLSARDIDVYITELDVDDTGFSEDPVARDVAVAERYAKFLAQVLAYPRLKMIVTWQLADRYSYYRTLALRADPAVTRLPRPLPFDEGFRRKPAWQAMARAFERRAA